MNRIPPHELHALPQTDPAPGGTTPGATGRAGLADAHDAAAEPAGDSAAEPMSFSLRVLAWLPLRLWTDCGVCLFWRGAAVGALGTGALMALAWTVT